MPSSRAWTVGGKRGQWSVADWNDFFVDDSGYNELILDSLRYPWEPVLAADPAALVEAVSVPVQATAEARAYGAAVRDSFARRFNLTLPLVSYNMSAVSTPFRWLSSPVGATGAGALDAGGVEQP